MAIAEFQRIGDKTFQDDSVTATPEEIAVVSRIVYGFEVDNSQNTENVFFKMYDVATAPAIGSAVPEHVWRVLAGEKLGIVFDADGSGHDFSTGLFVVCVTAGGTGGTVSPTNPVPLVMVTD